MQYDPFLDLEDVETVFKTGRGSAYGFFKQGSTQRNRSGEGHTDKTVGLQPKSLKTVFVQPQHLRSIGSVFQNPEISTELIPIFKDGKQTNEMGLSLLEDYGPKKAGTVIQKVPFVTKPEVGLHPVEIYNPRSPIGSEGRGVHFGSTITEVQPKASLLKNLPGKLGGIAALAGITEKASAGELKKAAADVLESAIPLSFSPSEAKSATLFDEKDREKFKKMSEEEQREYVRRRLKMKTGGFIVKPLDGSKKII